MSPECRRQPVVSPIIGWNLAGDEVMNGDEASLYVQGPFWGFAIGPDEAAFGSPQNGVDSASVFGVVEDMEAVNLRGQDGAVGD